MVDLLSSTFSNFYTFLLDFLYICYELCKLILTFTNKEKIDQLIINHLWNSSKVHIMSLQLESIYSIDRKDNRKVTNSDNGWTPRKLPGSTAKRKKRSKDAWWKGTETKQRKKQKRSRTEAHIRWNKGNYCGAWCQSWPYNDWRVQLNKGRSLII